MSTDVESAFREMLQERAAVAPAPPANVVTGIDARVRRRRRKHVVGAAIGVCALATGVGVAVTQLPNTDNARVAGNPPAATPTTRADVSIVAAVSSYFETSMPWQTAHLGPTRGGRVYCSDVVLGARDSTHFYAYVDCEAYVASANGPQLVTGTAVPAVVTVERVNGGPTVIRDETPSDSQLDEFMAALPPYVRRSIANNEFRLSSPSPLDRARDDYRAGRLPTG